MDWRPISADSHITEPPNCYVDHIDPAWRERAPHVVHKEGMGDIYVVDGMKTPVPMGLVAAAGVAAQGYPHRRREVRGPAPRRLGSRRRGSPTRTRTAWPPRSSIPRSACCSATIPTSTTRRPASTPTTAGSPSTAAHDPDRLIGMGQTAMRTVKEGIADLERIKAMGLRGVMMPGNPGEKDYDDPGLRPVLGGRRRARAAARRSTS